MGGGGKGGKSPPPVTPTFVDPVNGETFYSANDLNTEIRTRQDADTAKSNADTQAATDKANAAEADFQKRAADAKSLATQNINQYFTDHGVDPSKYATQIADMVNTAASHVQDPNTYVQPAGTSASGNATTTLFPDPSSAYAPTMGSDLFNQLQSGAQSQTLNTYNSQFSPSYSQTALSDSLINPAVSNAVSTQIDPLTAQLTNAYKRGTLNATGYAAAQKALDADQSNATSSITKLANNVLASDRSDLDSYLGTGRTAAGSVPLGTNFDLTPYVSGANSRVANDVSNFGGDVNNAVGSTSYGDISSLLNAGGAVQGVNDPTAANPNGAVGPGGVPIGGAGAGDLSPAYIAQQANAKAPRGVGSTGDF